MTQFDHTSVLLNETLAALSPRAGGVYADATVGGAGHAAAVLEASGPDGRLVAIDRDPRAVEAARQRLARFGDRVTVLHGTILDLPQLLTDAGASRVDGLVADLGVSSPQLDDADRGFSFARSGPLDMRMDTSQGETAAELLDRVDAEELATIIYRLGEERRSRPIARSILAARDRGELQTTADLRRAIVRVTGPRRRGVDPATRTFQALRLAVNQELEQLEGLVSVAPELLADGGVVVIISFHSLEDRIVKHAFRDDTRLSPLTKKPVVASDTERAENPRARSAKLRAARRLPRSEAP